MTAEQNERLNLRLRRILWIIFGLSAFVPPPPEIGEVTR
jgi:hypothetical protein